MITTNFNVLELYEYYKKETLNEQLYILQTKKEFEYLLQTNSIFVSKTDSIDGFILFNIADKEAFITLLYGTKKERLLQTFEESVKSTCKTIWIHFKNPTTLPWYPLTDVTHPGTQGVVNDSPLHLFYKKHDYQDYALIDTYYQPLKNYTFPQKLQNIEKDLNKKDFSISFYDPTLHKNINQFCEDINSEGWKNVIINNINKDNPHPLLVATHKNTVIGFTGPLYKEKMGRGYFAGIGVLKDYNGLKLGTLLFNHLCDELKNMDASYMTLFTGRNNNAKHIYIKTGFQVVKTFMILKKSL